MSFLSGYGNILKAGKIFKAFSLGEKLILKSKTFTKIAIGARKASGYMEMTAGVGNALLKLTGTRDTELGRKISQVLFYLEMAALTGEITAALHGSIKRASLEAIENTTTVDKIRKKAQKIVDDATDKKTKEFLQAQDDLAALKQLEEFAGIKSKKVIQFNDFANKWRAKDLSKLSIKNIVDHLKGFTEQANAVARAIERGEIKVNILSKKEFDHFYKKLGDDGLDGVDDTAAFCYGEEVFFKTEFIDPLTNKLKKTSPESLMSQIVHEGSHAIDYLEDFGGNNWNWEKRAYFWERQFQIAVGLDPEFETIEEMINFITTYYDKI